MKDNLSGDHSEFLPVHSVSMSRGELAGMSNGKDGVTVTNRTGRPIDPVAAFLAYITVARMTAPASPPAGGHRVRRGVDDGLSTQLSTEQEGEKRSRIENDRSDRPTNAEFSREISLTNLRGKIGRLFLTQKLETCMFALT